MKLAGFDFKPFSIKFLKPFQNSSGIFTERKGFIIKLTDEMGISSFGEASSLEGFSVETYADVKLDLIKLKETAAGICFDPDYNSLKSFCSSFNLTNSVLFGFSQALAGLAVKRNENYFTDCFGNQTGRIKINAAVGAMNKEEVIGFVKRKIDAGYRTIKIKAGRDEFDEDLEIIKSVRNIFGSEVKLRLDVNGRWNYNNSLQNLSALSSYNIEYIEEPCGGINNLLAISEVSPIPIAVDESLRNAEDAELIMTKGKINFIVLKPMIYGGVFGTLELIKQAKAVNKNIIISTSFESSVGRSMLFNLAHAAGLEYAHGLDSEEYVKDDFCGVNCSSAIVKPNYSDYPLSPSVNYEAI